MGTRVAVLKDGLLQQVDNPQVLYDHPANIFVAAFIGSPSMNLYQGRLSTIDGTTSIAFGGQSLPVPAGVVAAKPELAASDEREVVIGLRPEAFEEPTSASNERPTVRVIVELIESLGAELVVHTTIDAQVAEIDLSDLVGATPIVDGVGAPCITRLPSKSNLTVGESMDLAVDMSDVQIFDAATGLTLRAAG